MAIVNSAISIHIVFSYTCPLDLLSIGATYLYQWSGQGDQTPAQSDCWSVGGQEGSAEGSEQPRPMVQGQRSEV